MDSHNRKDFQSVAELPPKNYSYAAGIEFMSDHEQSARRDIMLSCSENTCYPDARKEYEFATKTARMLGSNDVAAILFIYKCILDKAEDFYPIVVENPSLPDSLSEYFMIFDARHNKVFDFTVDIASGGAANYRPDIQLAVLRSALSDPTIIRRLENGLRNMSITEDAVVVIQLFVDRFHACFQKLNPKKAFKNIEQI